MVSTETVTAPYSDAERFDADFKKRQTEINNEISIWSQSESFRSRAREVMQTSINDHDSLVNLSRRLFENGIFTASFKELTKKEIEATRYKTWGARLSVFSWLLIGGVVTFAIEVLIRKCFVG